MPETPAPLSQQLGRLGRLVRKEVSEILRDRRTIVTLVLMPLLLYPLLAIGFRQFFLSRMLSQSQMVYRLGFTSEDDYRLVEGYLARGESLFKLQQPRTFADGRGALEPKVMAIQLDGKVGEAALLAGQVDVIITFNDRESLPKDRQLSFAFPLELQYDESSATGKEAAAFVERRLAAANSQKLGEALVALGTPQPSVPIALAKTVRDPDQSKSLTVAALIPLVLILMTITGAVYPAIDLTAGERERGTLELLVAAPIPRLGVLFAKYVSVVTVAMLTALVNLVTMTITLLVSGLGAMLFSAGLTIGVVCKVFFLLLLFAAFFSAVLLILTSFARSFKEAQAYLIPLMLAALAPGLASLVPGIRLEGLIVVTPLLNVVLLARDLFDGSAALLPSAIVIGSTLLYAAAALSVAARVFGAEDVLYGEQGTWGDLLLRPEEPTPVAGTTTALLCLAIMFPLSFVINGLQGQLREIALPMRLWIQVAANLVLFLGVPLIAMHRGRVRLTTGLRFGGFPWIGALAAALIGLSGWVISHELLLLAQSAKFTTFNEAQHQAVRSMITGWRTASLPLLLLAQALVPALVEEIFFRGFLLGALLGTMRPVRAVLLSGLLFGLFHLLLGGFIVVERLVPSIMMGVLLAWLCYRSGSIWPGVLLHMIHNALLVSLGYYEEWISGLGWNVDAQEHLPTLALVAGSIAFALGIACIAAGRLKSED